MLPSNSRGTVYINPNFKTTHINPKFLRNNIISNSIHINPAFLENQQIEQSNINTNSKNLPLADLLPKQIENSICSNNEDYHMDTEAKIIPKSRTKLVRLTNTAKLFDKSAANENLENNGHLLKIGLRKLIRSSTVTKVQPVIVQNTNKFVKKNLNCNTLKPIKLSSLSNRNLKAPKQKYKIDRRIIIKPTNFLSVIKKKSFVSRFALCRNNMTLTPKKVAIAQENYIKKMLPKGRNISSSNLKLELLNINGVLYKSTRTKLQRSITDQKCKIESKTAFSNINKKSTGDRILFVRGTKFVLDKSGLKLTKIQSNDSKNLCEKVPRNNMKRIDIGGLTYVAKSNNVFVRTDVHVTRNYLSVTKQKSINTLHNRMFKTNIPCPIYRKLGKCVAFEKGKCPKLHEKKQIAICSKFLKGECTKSNCLLSHNVNYSKMPVCKFFLQGCCVREDCPYLHRKLGKTVEICPEFLKGFCILAENCPKRHEFLCPDFESKGKCEKINCIYCKKRIKENLMKELKLDKDVEQKKKVLLEKVEKKLLCNDNSKNNKESELSRYFVEQNKTENKNCSEINCEAVSEDLSTLSCDSSDSENENFETKIFKRPKLGKLPSYIPL